MTEHRWNQLLWGAFVFLLVSRLSLVLTLGTEVKQWSDLEWYLSRAYELLRSGQYAENGIPTAYWPVGYPAFLAGVMALTKPTALAGQFANVALSALTLILLHRWCLQRFNDQRIACTAALMLAAYPNHMGYSVGLYSEPLFTCMLLGLFLIVRPDASLWRIALAGVVAGLATLVKAQTLVLGPLLLLVLSIQRVTPSGLARAIGRATFGTALMAATIAPWTYRNHAVMGSTVLVSTNGGMSLLAGNNPSMTTDLDSDYNDKDPSVSAVRFSVPDQVAADARARAAAWAWISENPIKFVTLMPKKLFRLWAIDGESEWLFQARYPAYDTHRLIFRTMRLLNQAYYGLLLLGFFLAWRRWLDANEPAILGVPLTILFFSALSMVFSGQSRYHAPLMPLIIAFAAWTLCNLRWRGLKS